MEDNAKTNRGVTLLFFIFCFIAFSFRIATAETETLSWKFGKPIDSVIAYHEDFLFLSDGSVWRCSLGSEEPAILLQAANDAPFAQLFTDSVGNVWALSMTKETYTIYSISVDESKAGMMYQIPKFESFPGAVTQALWSGEKIVLELESDIPRKSNMLFFDTNSGEIKTFANCDITNLTSYKGNLLLGLQRRFQEGDIYKIVSLDVDTNKISEICSIDKWPEALCFDPQKNLIVSFLSPNATLYSNSGEQQKQLYFPVLYDGYENRRCVVNSARLLAISDGDLLLAVHLDENFKTAMLKIASFKEERPETKKFRASNPEIPVQSIDLGYSMTPAVVGQQIRSQDSTFDIYMVRTFEVGYTALLDKGFCADLSGEEALYTEMMRMPTTLSDPLMRSGKLLGVPVQMEFDTWTSLVSSQETLGDVGVLPEELPQNMLDLLDKLIEWYENGTLYGVRLFDYPVSRQSFVLTWFTLKNYTYYHSDESKPLDYDTPLFRTLMEKCDRLKTLLNEHSAITDSSPALFSYGSPDSQLFGQVDQETFFLPLTPQAGMVQRYPVYLTLAILNPLSQNEEQALTYLSAIIDELPVKTKLFLWPDHTEPMERVGYQEDCQEMLDEIIRYRDLLDAGGLGEADKANLQGLLTASEEALAYIQKETRWELSPQMIEDYRAIAGNVCVPGSIVAEILDEPMTEHVEQYAEGKIDCAALIEILIRKTRMIQTE